MTKTNLSGTTQQQFVVSNLIIDSTGLTEERIFTAPDENVDIGALQTNVETLSGDVATISGDVTTLDSVKFDKSGGDITGNITPNVASTLSIGTSAKPFGAVYADEVYASASSIYINGKKVLEDVNDTITVSTDVDQNLTMKTTGLGVLQLQSQKNINISATGTGEDVTISTNGDINLTSTQSVYINSNVVETRNNKGIANGYAGLDSGAKLPIGIIPDVILGQVEYKGNWNAATNSPALSNPASSENKGDYYICISDGTQLGLDFSVGDWVISDGTSWTKVDNTDAVMTVFGRKGTVVANSGDYTASQITNTPAGNITATTAQAALNQLDSIKEPAFSKNNAFNKNFGTGPDTVCQGNDSRLSDARTPTAHTHGGGDITSTVANATNASLATTAHYPTVHTVTGDWNNIVTSGFYMGADLLNQCPGSSWRYCVVIVHNTDWISQTMNDFSGTGFYHRNKSSGVWGAWRRIDNGSDTNAYGTRYVSASDPSGGSDGDIWYKV